MLKNKSIGIIGGGQLAQMFIENCNRFGVRINVLGEQDCPAQKISSTFIEGDVNDEGDIRTLSRYSDIITFEMENINCDALTKLESEGKEIIPRPHVLKMIQDKTSQKEFFRINSLNTVEFRVIDSLSELEIALSDLEIRSSYVLKFDKGGYDGKGVFIIKNGLIPDEVKNHRGRFVVEQYHQNIREISVLAYVDKFGKTGLYDPVEMIFDKELNLIDHLITPTNLDRWSLNLINNLARQVVSNLDSPGLFAIEMFLIDDEVFVNEISPRPHNSGHHTIESAKTSQYEQLLRILMGWPCGSTEVYGKAAMVNIIGPSEFSGDYNFNYNELLDIEDIHLHLYGKTTTKPGRKMGHITITSQDMRSIDEKVKVLKSKSFIQSPNMI